MEGEPRSEVGAAPIAAILLGAALVGGILGGILGFTGGLDLVGEGGVVGAAVSAPYFECPDGDRLGELQRGDRVFVTARNPSGEWVQVRSPADSAARVWMVANHVIPDAELGGLPARDCMVPVEVIVVAAGGTTTTTTEAPDQSTTTSITTTTTIPPTTTTSTAASPLAGPPSANPGTIWESYFAQADCNSNSSLPSVTTLSSSVSAPAGVQSVMLLWAVGSVSGSKPMSDVGGQYQATLGPFDAEDPDVVPQGSSLDITITIRVTDTQNRTAESQATITLNDCTFG